ncbi:MAG: glycyl-radical enzyme activating protein [Proteiniphilum sp.]|nr:glycyl-radical enzyme activating protein [Bacteroidales bacterium]MDD4800566.1 glycyl-radical enzyme activating protein [Proteiniphilum sp.]
MEGIIFDIKHFAVHDGPGIRQTIFLKGCPLSCWWCHNPESQDPKPEKFIRIHKLDGQEYKKEETAGYQISVGELFTIIQGDQIFYEESGGGVTFSGGEPLMQYEFLAEMLKLCKMNHIHTCIDTTGYASLKIIEKIALLADCFLFDLKLMNHKSHQKYTGVPVERILNNLRWLDNNQANVVLRFPVIPGITDTTKNIGEIKSFIQTLQNIHQIDLLPYHDVANGKYERFHKENKMKGTRPLSDREMLNLKLEFEAIGLKVGIGG